MKSKTTVRLTCAVAPVGQTADDVHHRRAAGHRHARLKEPSARPSSRGGRLQVGVGVRRGDATVLPGTVVPVTVTGEVIDD